MASHSRVFNISFRTLLAAIAEELGWSEPIYSQFNMVENSAYVVLRRSHSPIAYYFSGTSKATLAESEEEAAEKAFYYLVQKRRVIVDDVNLERRRMYTTCSRFYKDKRTALELIKRVPARVSMLGAGGANTQPPRNRPKKLNMKPEKKLVKDLTDKTGPYSIKLKVIVKNNTQTSPNNKALTFQRITFEDEEGGRIKTTLYNDEIEAYENVIQDKMEYEITNAKLKPVPEKYLTNPQDHPYQLSFNNSTVIQPVPGSQPPTGQDYIVLASIPRVMTLDDRYDVLGIVLYVEPLRTIPRQTGQDLEVREIVITDHSTTQPMVVTAWADLAVKEGETVHNMAESFPVVGFTSLRNSYHKGFSLATTNSTFFKFEPVGEKADAIRAWKEANEGLIAAKAQQVLEIRLPETQRIPITIKTLREKKVATTMQEERHWLHVNIPEFDKKDVRFYLGCNKCGTRSNQDVGAAYTCQACGREGAISSPRMNITFEAIDATGLYAFTAFTEDAEKLLETKANSLCSLPPEEKEEYLGIMETKIRAHSLYIQVGPATSLSRSRVLKWVLKQLSLA